MAAAVAVDWLRRQTTACLGYTPSALARTGPQQLRSTSQFFRAARWKRTLSKSEAVLKQRQAQVDNLRGSIEQDIENALLDLKAAAQQVEVAKTGLDYAQQTLEQSQDRFAAGVTNNVEVIQAQQQLASANEQYIASLYGHNIAKVLLARAIGNAEQAVKQYLSEPGSVLPAAPGTAGQSGNQSECSNDTGAGSHSRNSANAGDPNGPTRRPTRGSRASSAVRQNCAVRDRGEPVLASSWQIINH